MCVDDERWLGTGNRGEVWVVRRDENGMGETSLVFPICPRERNCF